MIHTSKQLKDKVRNLSKGDNDIAKALMWERFRKKNYFVGELQWREISGKVIRNMQKVVVEKQ